MRRKKGFYSISVVAEMFSVHQQTIRMYEKEGLISPKRTEGNTRLFSEEDIDRLEQVINYTHKMGINLAGVQMILKLQKKITRLQGEMNKVFNQMQGQLEEEGDKYKSEARIQGEQLVGMKDKQTVQQKERSTDMNKPGVKDKKGIFATKEIDSQDESQADEWQIEYDEKD